MIEQILNDPALRVFNVDRDCYVIFLGSDTDARRAFLRMGNSAALPEAVLLRIEGLICTDELLGDVFAEQKWLSGLTGEQRPYFAGTPDVLRRYKSFFALDKTLAAKYQSTQRILSVEDRGAFIYYTGADQITVTLDADLLFSLRKRAASNFHFDERNAEIARTVSTYNSAYNSNTLPQSGFFVIESALYLCDRERIFAVEPPVDCYAHLAAHGFDARLISDGVHSRLGQPFLSLLMNNSLKSPLAQWHFYDPNKEITAAARNRVLNFARKQTSLNILSDRFEVSGSTFKLSKPTGASGHSYEVLFEQNHRCTIDIERKSWHLDEDGKSWHGELIPNIPYTLSLQHTHTTDQLLHAYLPSAFEQSTHRLTRAETLMLNAGIRFLKAKTEKKLALYYQQLSDGSSKVVRSAKQLTLYALYNIRTVLESRLAECKEQKEGGWIEKASKVVRQVILRIAPDSVPELYLPAKVVILRTSLEERIQLIQYDWNRDYHYTEHEMDIRQRIVDVVEGAGEDFYSAERARLLQLVAELDGTGKATDTTVQNQAEEHEARSVLQPEKRIEKKRKSYGGQPRRTLRFIIIGIVAILIGALLTLFVVNRAERDDDRAQGAAVTENAAAITDGAATDTDDATTNDTATDTDDATTNDTAAATDTDNAVATDTTATDAADLAAVRARVTGGALAESNFTSTLTIGAVFLSDTYLSVESPLGTVTVTVGEIVRVVNRIARASGFREIGVEDVNAGDDPDLIYPFDQLVLPPHSDNYRITENDSLWVVAVSLIESQIKDVVSQLAEITAIIDAGQRTPEVNRVLQEIIAAMITDSYSASLADIAREVAQRLRIG